VLIGLMIAAVPFVLLLSVLGVPLQASAGVPPRPASILVGLAYVAVVVFIGVRFLLSSPVASAEHVGPIAILRRSWDLTAGHWWQLFGFVFMILVSALILLIAVGSAIGVIINLLFGPIDPMSAAALVLALVQSLVSAVITTLFAVMLARIYLQLSGAAGAHASVPRSGT